MEFKFKINSTIKDNIINATLLPSPMNFIPASVSAPIQTALTSAPASVSSKSESTSLKIKQKASDFEKKYQYLKLSANVKNGLFYKTQKTVILYDFTDQQIVELINSGVKIEDQKENISNKEFNVVKLPQSRVLPVSFAYDKINVDVFNNLNNFMQHLNLNKNETTERILHTIALSNNRLLITSGYRDNLYQQWIRNTGGGRGNQSTGKRNIKKFAPMCNIPGVAQVGKSQHNESNAVDILYKKNKYSDNLDDLKTAVDMILLLKDFGFKGFGFYSSGHIHVDTRQSYTFWFQLKKGQAFKKIPAGKIYNNKDITSISNFKKHVLSLLRRK